MPRSSQRITHASSPPPTRFAASIHDAACRASPKRRESIRSQLGCAAGLLLLLPGELNKALVEERTQRRPGRQHSQRRERLLLQQVSRLLQRLLLRQAGIVGACQQQIQIEAFLRLHGQRHGQQGRHEHGIEGGCRRQSKARQRKTRLQHLIQLHGVHERGCCGQCCSKLRCRRCRCCASCNRIVRLCCTSTVSANSHVAALLAVPVLRLAVLARAVSFQAFPALPLLLTVFANAAASALLAVALAATVRAYS